MGLFRYILGGEARRNLKKLDKLADKVISLQEKYEVFSDEERREQTDFLRED
jgi:preprotein translocase subunit SecA